MIPYEVFIRDAKVVVPDHGIVEADAAIEGANIARVLPPDTASARSTVDARGSHMPPGVLDNHTHRGYRGDFSVHCRSAAQEAQ
jgi:dihydroorotase-like cyclic amidohydrolase